MGIWGCNATASIPAAAFPDSHSRIVSTVRIVTGPDPSVRLCPSQRKAGPGNDDQSWFLHIIPCPANESFWKRSGGVQEWARCREGLPGNCLVLRLPRAFSLGQRQSVGTAMPRRPARRRPGDRGCIPGGRSFSRWQAAGGRVDGECGTHTRHSRSRMFRVQPVPSDGPWDFENLCTPASRLCNVRGGGGRKTAREELGWSPRP